MCGRFAFNASREQVQRQFGVPTVPALTPRYNVAPTQVIAVIGQTADGTRKMAMLRWGLIPSWSSGPRPGPINARSETIAQKPTFRDSFRERRCLIPSTGFYEWQKVGSRKVPHLIRLRSQEPYALAGIWDIWGEGKERIAICCIITVAANDLVRPLHERMPAILRPEEYGAWLDPKTPLSQVQALLRPYPAEEMEVVRVGQAVNSPRNDGPECVAPAA